MRKNKQKNKLLLAIVSFVLVLVLLVVAGISATERDKQKVDLKGKKNNPVKKESKKKKTVKAPVIFVPTEEVSADQAVAFPTDI